MPFEFISNILPDYFVATNTSISSINYMIHMSSSGSKATKSADPHLLVNTTHASPQAHSWGKGILNLMIESELQIGMIYRISMLISN